MVKATIGAAYNLPMKLRRAAKTVIDTAVSKAEIVAAMEALISAGATPESVIRALDEVIPLQLLGSWRATFAHP